MDIFNYLFNNTDSIIVIITYFIPGASLVYTYRFVCKNIYKGEEDANLIFKSVIISGIIFLATDWIWNLFSFNNGIVKIIVLSLFCVILGYIIGLLRYYGVLDKLIIKIGIKQTTNLFWDDVFEKAIGSHIQFESGNIIYFGSLEYWNVLDDGEVYFSIIRASMKQIGLPMETVYCFSDKERLVFTSKNVKNIIIKNNIIEKKYRKK